MEDTIVIILEDERIEIQKGKKKEFSMIVNKQEEKELWDLAMKKVERTILKFKNREVKEHE